MGSAIAVPAQVGTLSAESSPEEECEDSLRFEMTDRATLAYAPIARFSVSIDGGEEQLWVDYGALPVTVAEQGSSAQFVLPRCGLTACLPEGRHQLRLRMDIAGVDAQPLPSQLDFYVRCPLPDTDLDSTTDSGSGCKLSAPSSGTLTALPALAALVSAFLGRRRRANPSAAP